VVIGGKGAWGQVVVVVGHKGVGHCCHRVVVVGDMPQAPYPCID
jgi:hypothetical protein